MIRGARSATPPSTSSRGCTLYSSAEARDRRAVTLAGMANNLPKRQLRVHRGPLLFCVASPAPKFEGAGEHAETIAKD